MDEREKSIRMRMTQIAEALELSPDHFFTEVSTRGSVADASECLRLWCRIKTPQGRRLALETLRAFADAEDA